MESSGTVRPRIMGAELETSLCVPFAAADQKYRFPGDLKQFFHEPIDGLHSQFRNVSNMNSSTAMLVNGARLYLDVGNNVEACTPECSGFDQVTRYVVAMDHMILGAIQNYLPVFIEEKKDPQVAKLIAHRRVVAYEDYMGSTGKDNQGLQSVGLHENYYVKKPEGMSIEKLAEKMAGFLIGRTVFNGAGIVDRSEGGYPVIVPAQKAQHVVDAYTTSTTKNKPWIAARDEPHNGQIDDHWRIQVIGGDASLSPWATRFTFASTSMVLRLIENDIDPGLTVVNVKEASQAAAMDWNGTAKIQVEVDGKPQPMTPIEMQEHYLKVVKDHVKDNIFSQDELDFLPEWEQAVHEFKTDQSKLTNAVDWIFKRAHLIDHGISTINKMRLFDMRYTALYGVERRRDGVIGPGIGWLMREAGEFRHNIEPDIIQYDLRHAPIETRAARREEIITAMHEIPDIQVSSKQVEWARASLKRKKDRGVSDKDAEYIINEVKLDDPYGEASEEAVLAMKEIEDIAETYRQQSAA